MGLTVSFAFQHEPVASGHLIVASGDVDVTAIDEMSTLLAMAIAGTTDAVILDLSGVTFVDSTALGTILQAVRQVERVGKRLLVVAPDGPVRRLLELTGLAQSIKLYDRRGDAVTDSA